MDYKIPCLPHLPFGDHISTSLRTQNQLLDVLSQIKRLITEVAFKEVDVAHCKFCHLQIGTLALLTGATDAHLVRGSEADHLTASIALRGNGSIKQGRNTLNWKSGESAIFANYSSEQELISSKHTFVTIIPRVTDLKTVIRSMQLGSSDAKVELQENTHVFKTTSRGFDFHRALLTLCQLVNDTGCSADRLEMIGVDDVLYRLMATLLLHESYSCDLGNHDRRSEAPQVLDAVCDTILSRIGKPLSSTEMEQLSGLSDRGLRYAFRKRFNCSPQEWQRNVRLEHARRIFTENNEAHSIKSIAYSLGFSTPQAFTYFYRRRFGERPSETTARRTIHKSAFGRMTENDTQQFTPTPNTL